MIKTFLSALSVILFVIPIIAYSFFPSSNLNILILNCYLSKLFFLIKFSSFKTSGKKRIIS